MSKLIEKMLHSQISRRDFLRGSAVATASVAALSLAGCNKTQVTESTATEGTAAPTTGSEAAIEHIIPEDVEKQGKWITAACWHNCGGRCLNKALVVDGVVVRQKTDDTHEDSPEFPQQRACVRGRSQRKQVFAADRLKTPMKRKHWEPGTGGDRSLRGKDEWEQISWDEALDYVAAEIKRVKETYGNRSIFLDSWTMNNEYKRPLGLYGGYINGWGTCSFGNWSLTPQVVGYSIAGGFGTCNDRFDFVNCEKIVLLGCNPAWSSFGMSTNILMEAKKAGTEFVGIDPFYNDTLAVLDADWIPVRPSSDTALLLGLAHTLITEDDPEKNPLIDWEFLKKTSIGFDADSMPEGEDPKGNFKDYVLGTYDGVPKDAEWASERCGAPAERIRQLANEMGMKHKVAFLCSWGIARTNNSDNLPQLFMTIGAMTGHMGKSGHMTGVSCHNNAANHGPTLVQAGGNGLPDIPNPMDDYVNDPQTWDMILGEKYNYTGNCSDGIEWKPCEMREADIHLIFHGSGNRLQSRQAILKGVEAHRKVDFVVTATTFFTNDAKYSDIVLPVNTEWEREGGFLGGNKEMVIMYSQVTESLYESKDDQWIAEEIGVRLGLDRKEMYPFGRKQQLFNMAAGATVVKEGEVAGGSAENGSGLGTIENDIKDGYEHLCAITEEDIKEWGVEGTPQEGRIPISELKEKGIFQIERKAGDAHSFIAFEDFRKDPEANPSKYSESGKFEIFSRTLAEKVEKMGYSKIDPIPTYIEPLEGYEQTFRNWDTKEKGEYPYQAVTIHYLKRSHTTFDNIPWLKEAYSNPVLIHTRDAEALGIKEGDPVLMTSKFGKSLRTATVTNRIMQGCIGLYHGSWSDYDEESGIDKGGSDNILFGNTTTGQGTSGFNSLLLKVEKYDGEPLVPDVEKPLRIVF